MPKIDWLTGRAAPYRRPIWNSLGNMCDLKVRLLENTAQFRRKPGNRPADWYEIGLGRDDVASVRTARFQHGEENYYLALQPPLRSGLDGAVLGGWESPAYWQALAQLRSSRNRARAVGFYESTLATQGHPRGPIAASRQWYFRHLDAVVVPGEASASAVAEMGIDDRRIFVGFNPVDVEWIAHNARRFDPTTPGHRFLFIGQLVARKNPIGLLRAYAACRAESDTLTLVGKGELSEVVTAEIARLELRDSVELIPAVSYQEVPQILGRHDTLVLASSVEVWGLVVNEALAAGLHAVVSRMTGVASSTVGMKGVYLCQPHEADIARAMAASRHAWMGPIKNPAMLQHTPAKFAEVFASALLG